MDPRTLLVSFAVILRNSLPIIFLRRYTNAIDGIPFMFWKSTFKHIRGINRFGIEGCHWDKQDGRCLCFAIDLEVTKGSLRSTSESNNVVNSYFDWMSDIANNYDVSPRQKRFHDFLNRMNGITSKFHKVMAEEQYDLLPNAVVPVEFRKPYWKR